MKLKNLLQEQILTEGKLDLIAKMAIKMQSSSEYDNNYGKFISEKRGRFYTLKLEHISGIEIPLIEYLTSGDNPYIKFIMPDGIEDVLDSHHIKEIVIMFADIFNNGVGNLIEEGNVETEVIARNTTLKAEGTKTVRARPGETLILDRKTAPAVERSDKLK